MAAALAAVATGLSLYGAVPGSRSRYQCWSLRWRRCLQRQLWPGRGRGTAAGSTSRGAGFHGEGPGRRPRPIPAYGIFAAVQGLGGAAAGAPYRQSPLALIIAVVGCQLSALLLLARPQPAQSPPADARLAEWSRVDQRVVRRLQALLIEQGQRSASGGRDGV